MFFVVSLKGSKVELSCGVKTCSSAFLDFLKSPSPKFFFFKFLFLSLIPIILSESEGAFMGEGDLISTQLQMIVW